MFLCCSTFNSCSKILSPIQTQAIGYTNIFSDLWLALGLSISLDVHKNHVKIRQLVFTMMKYIFCCSIFNSCSTILSPTQTQAIGHTNISSDLQFPSQKPCQNQTASNYYGEIFFCCSNFNSYSKKAVTHTNPSHWLYKHSQWPSIWFWIVHQLGCSQKPCQNQTTSNYYGEICLLL